MTNNQVYSTRKLGYIVNLAPPSLCLISGIRCKSISTVMTAPTTGGGQSFCYLAGLTIVM